MRYKLPGIEKKTVKSCADQTQVLLGLKKATVKRKPRKIETKPRERHEAKFRNEVIKYLRNKGYFVKGIENGVCGHLGRGVPDLLFFTSNRFFFCELKSEKGVLSPEQTEFREKCLLSGTGYILARKIIDIEKEIQCS